MRRAKFLLTTTKIGVPVGHICFYSKADAIFFLCQFSGSKDYRFTVEPLVGAPPKKRKLAAQTLANDRYARKVLQQAIDNRRQ